MSPEPPFDPEVEKAIKRQLQMPPPVPEEPAPDGSPLLASELWVPVGHCPSCGAPIWARRDEPAAARPPQHYYTCACSCLAHERAFSERVKRAQKQKMGPTIGLSGRESVNGNEQG